MERAAESLRTFSLDILAQVHQITTQPSATKQELEEVGSMYLDTSIYPSSFNNSLTDGLENLEVMLHIIHSFGDELPAACQNSCQEAWVIFDSFLDKYGTSFDLAERATRVIRHGISLFGDAALPVAPSVLGRMSLAFELTGFPSFLWIAGKIINRFGGGTNRSLQVAIQEIYERSTNKVASLLQLKSPGEIPDGERVYVNFEDGLIFSFYAQC